MLGRVISRASGLLAALPLPTALRTPFYRAFAKRYQVNLAEVAEELESFPTFSHFFSRALRSDARPIDAAKLISPVDGEVVEVSQTEQQSAVQAKDEHFASLGEFLGSDSLAKQLTPGTFIRLYLAPGDYHRIHAPCALRVVSARQIRGSFWPVAPWFLKLFPRSYRQNERIVLQFVSDAGEGALVLVGALNVGSIALSPKLSSVPCDVEKGEEIAQFRFGSTVVLLLPGRITTRHRVAERVKMGEEL